jgi:AAA domain
MIGYGREHTDEAGEPLPYPVVRRMSDVQPERVSWLWPGYLAAGKLHVVDGDPGLGKSSMTLDWAARLTTGKPWPDGADGPAPRGVLLVSAEDGLADTIRPRLDAAGADVDRVHALTGIAIPTAAGVDERMPALPRDVEQLVHIIGEYDVGLAVVDPLMAYLGADVDSYRDQDVRRALAPLARAAEQTGCAVVLVRHLRKGGGSALYRGGGSIGIIGAARFGYAVGRDPDDSARRVIAATKSNLAVEPASLAFRLVDAGGAARVEWDGIVAHTAGDLLRERGDDDERAERDEAAEWLRGYLADQGGEAAFADLIRAARSDGHAERTLRRARSRAGVETTRSGFPPRSVWRLRTDR